jgi:transcriptional regulator with PAS, ATPase and Fis domain
MEQIKKDILLFASTDSSVLIIGESGTGKEIACDQGFNSVPKSGNVISRPSLIQSI